ncbi:hypothetical protein [Candidatus Hodgkinia cicadicola]|uniref:hypothetical protein n=1 Tax=Candidatus Hodgkinia cicadicola TaxID=573658 RepID=UPI001788B398
MLLEGYDGMFEGRNDTHQVFCNNIFIRNRTDRYSWCCYGEMFNVELLLLEGIGLSR